MTIIDHEIGYACNIMREGCGRGKHKGIGSRERTWGLG